LSTLALAGAEVVDDADVDDADDSDNVDDADAVVDAAVETNAVLDTLHATPTMKLPLEFISTLPPPNILQLFSPTTPSKLNSKKAHVLSLVQRVAQS
jgi:sulfite reductase alpha subunit-like flavoprotein